MNQLMAIAVKAIDTAASLGAQYSDARVILTRTENIEMDNGVVSELDLGETCGIGVRVLVEGAWGFASINSYHNADQAAARAVQVARASARVKKDAVRLAPEKAHRDRWQSPYDIDPFRIPLEQKIDLLRKVDQILRQKPEIVRATGRLEFIRERQFMATSEGALIDQEFLRSGGGYTAFSAGNGDTQQRSYPSPHGGAFRSGGYEFIESLKFLEHAARVRDEAVALLTAPHCPAGQSDLILEGHQLALQIHESVGHPLELDRVLGMEASFAGRSFATLEKKGAFQYGSPLVNLVADSTLPGGLATHGYDDDGVTASRWHVVQDGLFQTYFTNRELAHVLDEERSRGCSRAQGFAHIPIIRIPNLSLMPGDWRYDDLIADTDDGILMASNKSWSIDQMRLNFQFGCEIAWEIKGGKLGRMFKNPNYQGITPEFWRSCDAICDNDSWQLWGVHNCGKGEPMQVAEMTHGNAPARFRGVRIGV